MALCQEAVNPRCQEHWNCDGWDSGINTYAFCERLLCWSSLIHEGPESSRAKSSCLLEFSWQILGGQLFSTWIWSPSLVSSFVMERLGEEWWVETPADLLLAIYSFQPRNHARRTCGQRPNYLRAARGPQPWISGTPRSPITLGSCPDFFSM